MRQNLVNLVLEPHPTKEALPSLLGYVENVPSIPFLYPELLTNHILRLVLIGIFVHINLKVRRVIRPFVKRKSVMRIALGIWFVALALRMNIFLTIYYAMRTISNAV
jgi:hypothetical protein